MIAAYDPEDIAVEDENQRLRVFANVKGNLGPKPPVLSYRIVDPGVIKWEGTVTRSVSDLLRPPERDVDAPEREEAKLFLLEVLGEGGLSYTEIMKMAKIAGHSERTLKRAKADLGIISEAEGASGRRGVTWTWRLPEDDTESQESIKDVSEEASFDLKEPLLGERELGTQVTLVATTSAPPTQASDADRDLCLGSARALAFQEVELGPGRKVAAGETAWIKFVKQGDLEAIADAQTALDRQGAEVGA